MVQGNWKKDIYMRLGTTFIWKKRFNQSTSSFIVFLVWLKIFETKTRVLKKADFCFYSCVDFSPSPQLNLEHIIMTWIFLSVRGFLFRRFQRMVLLERMEFSKQATKSWRFVKQVQEKDHGHWFLIWMIVWMKGLVARETVLYYVVGKMSPSSTLTKG